MSWTNAFDLGACRVEVYPASGGAADYSAILTKGQGADLVFASSWAMHVAVSGSGVVTLNNTSGAGVETDAGVRVIPQYSVIAATGAHVLLPTSCSGSGDATADGSTLAGFTNGDASSDLTAQTPYSEIAAQTNTIGSSSVSPVVQFTPEFDLTTPIDYLVKRLQFEVDMEQDIEAPPFIGEVCVGVLATPAYATGAFSPDYYSDDGDHSAILSESGTGALVQASLKASLTIIVYASGQPTPVLDQVTVAYVGPLVLADSTPVDLTGFVQESQAGYRIGGMTARLDAGALVLGVTGIAGPTAIARAKITGEVCFRGTYNGS